MIGVVAWYALQDELNDPNRKKSQLEHIVEARGPSLYCHINAEAAAFDSTEHERKRLEGYNRGQSVTTIKFTPR